MSQTKLIGRKHFNQNQFIKNERKTQIHATTGLQRKCHCQLYSIFIISTHSEIKCMAAFVYHFNVYSPSILLSSDVSMKLLRIHSKQLFLAVHYAHFFFFLLFWIFFLYLAFICNVKLSINRSILHYSFVR